MPTCVSDRSPPYAGVGSTALAPANSSLRWSPGALVDYQGVVLVVSLYFPAGWPLSSQSRAALTDASMSDGAVHEVVQEMGQLEVLPVCPSATDLQTGLARGAGRGLVGAAHELREARTLPAQATNGTSVEG